MPTFSANAPSSPAVGNTRSDARGWRWRYNGVGWDSDGLITPYDPFQGFEGPFSSAETLPAHNGVSWVSPGNGSSRFWGTVPDSTGEPVMYTLANIATTGGWWSVAENYNTSTNLYTAGYSSIIFPSTSGSPTEYTTGASGTISHNTSASFSEVNDIDYYLSGYDTLFAQSRTSSSGTRFNWYRYNNYSTRPSGATSTQKNFQFTSTSAFDFESGYGSSGSATIPDNCSAGNSSLYAAMDRVDITFGSAMSDSDLGTEIASTRWDVRRGETVLGEWYFSNGSGTQTSNSNKSDESNHRRVRLYDVYYREIE